jgi:hypothetical protein
VTIIVNDRGVPLGYMPAVSADHRPLYDMQPIQITAYVARQLPTAPGIVRFNALTERLNTARTGHHPLEVRGVSPDVVQSVLDELARQAVK